jgi:ribosomal protein S18 acetylase RimI-like enzyme
LKTPFDMHVEDLSSVRMADLEGLWRGEVGFWRTRLLWDVSGTFAALRRIQERGGLAGKAVRANGRVVGYASYGVAGQLGVMSGLAVLPEWRNTGVGPILVQASIEAIRRLGVSRIETRFVSSDDVWLLAAFEREGFRTYWREFLRADLKQRREVVQAPAAVLLEPWQSTHLGEAAAMLQQAYAGGVDAEVHEQYRTVEGCHAILDAILNQGSCGILVPEASALARRRGRGSGFVLVTEIAPGQAHLTHIIVLPEYQHQGVGRYLLDYGLQRVAERRFETFSLIVSRANVRALGLYQGMGFQTVLAFPVGVWDA